MIAIDFEPEDVFQSLYHASCLEAFSTEPGETVRTPAEWCSVLEAKYCQLYLALESDSATASQLHKETLKSVRVDWKRFRSSRTCLFCLRRQPEHCLTCGHAFCDTCARIFGTKRSEMAYSYRVSECILCRTSDPLVVHIKPPTAGTRLLVLDGGGIRGAFTLQALQALDQYRKLPYPIYDDFDLALGTSTGQLRYTRRGPPLTSEAGGLIVLMFLLRRSLQDCTTTFKKLAKQVFARRDWFGGPFFAKLFEALSTLLTDSLYGAKEMEACVETAYGAGKLMFGNPGSSLGVSGLKIAVTTMAVSNSRLCILSNYNGIGPRRGRRFELTYCRCRANNRRLHALQALGDGGRSPHP